MQFQAKYTADPVGSHEAKIKAHPELALDFQVAEVSRLIKPLGGASPTSLILFLELNYFFNHYQYRYQ